MKAKDILEKYVKKEMRDKVGVIAICREKKDLKYQSGYWWHIYKNEELPGREYDIAIHIKSEER